MANKPLQATSGTHVVPSSNWFRNELLTRRSRPSGRALDGPADAMNTPRSIPYDPSLRGVVLFFALGVGIGSVNALPLIQSPIFMGAAIGSVVVAAVLMMRRAYWNRFLLVTDDVITVPSGFLRLRPRPVSLRGVQAVWVTRIFWTAVLRVRTVEGDVEIQDMYLPEPKMLWELKAFLEPLAVGDRGKP